MKKNNIRKVAGAIMVMSLITTCAIGTTFAKYTTGSSASDTARVAKWGVEVSTSGTLFGKQYKNVIVKSDAGSISVESSNEAKVVAPGTKNDVGMKISIKGQPEVDYTVSASYENTYEDIYLAAGEYAIMVKEDGLNYGTLNWENIYEYNESAGEFTPATAYEGKTYYRATNILNLGGDYYPIVWSVNNAAQASLKDALDAMVDGIGNATYNANTEINKACTLTWAWAFETNDMADTILGNLMAGNTTSQMVVKKKSATDYMLNLGANAYNLEVGCKLTIGATQVD